MSPLEHLEFEQRGNVVIGHVSGEIDLSNTAPVTERLIEATPNHTTVLVLDLSGTRYLDSSGVRMLFELAQRLRNRGQELRLVVPDDSNVKRVLLLTEVEQVVPMSPSIDEAVGEQPA